MILALEAVQECSWHQGGGISVAESCWAPPLSSPGSPLVVQGTEMGKAVLLGTDAFPSIALLMSNANWFRKHRENVDILFLFTEILEVQMNFKNSPIWNFIPFIDENFILCQGLFFSPHKSRIAAQYTESSVSVQKSCVSGVPTSIQNVG